MANFFTDNEDLKFHLSHPMMERIVALKERNYEDKDKYDYAPVDFEDAMDSYDKILEVVGEICGDVIDPNAESVDAEGPKVVDNAVVYAKGTSENIEALKSAGLIGMSLPRKYDGLNFPIVPYVMAAEMVSRADAGFANIWGLQDCAETIHEFGNDEVKDEFLPRFANEGAGASMDLTEPDAGSDLQAVQLKAHYDEEKGTWLLNGVKRFITNGDADIHLVLARSEEGTSDARGLSLFAYDRNEDCMIVRRIENKLGIKGSPTCELVFTNAPCKLVGDRKMGLIKYVMSLMYAARLGIGAQSVGIAEAAYREALSYAKEREQFGKFIIKYPAVYEMLSMMRAKTDAMRALFYECARIVDMQKAFYHIGKERKLTPEERKEGKYYTKLSDFLTPVLKMVSSEYCNQIAYDSLQIHGGSGFMKDYPIERIYRDARITTIYEGTTQLQVVAAIRGVGNNAFLDKIEEYSKVKVKPEYEYMKAILKEMTGQYIKAVALVNKADDAEYYDFHARRMVEMAGNIIMGYLLIIDAQRAERFKKSAEIFVNYARAENLKMFSTIENSDLKDFANYKIEHGE